ncbi:hypothetical protein [Paenisporosarcina sp. OV554]|uniref:hypothetical protein n=1 Tax=Paenisporosarcina sp. OV554 TaxID=2135694 RepID=UPI000D36AFC8|nr:hypothetical protein [Paenisporosarcina sp. OV554]PUB12203.1 hypothetical protein C8K15_1108 [Paenisporosarcina sp. OV554]
MSFGTDNQRMVQLEHQNVYYYLSEWADWTLRITLLDKDSAEEFVVYDAPHGLHVDWNKDKIEFKHNRTSVVKWDVDGSWCKQITETILDLGKKIDNKEVQLQKEVEEQKRIEQASKNAEISEKATRFEQKWNNK